MCGTAIFTMRAAHALSNFFYVSGGRAKTDAFNHAVKTMRAMRALFIQCAMFIQ